MATKRLPKLMKTGLAVGAIGGGVLVASLWHDSDSHARKHFAHVVAAGELNVRPTKPLPTRSDQLKSLASEEFDVLVIGGGATGAGCTLDAVSRGLKTALVEREDFGCGTSSRSTKLLHGGVRYLQDAILKLDYQQYKMVHEALRERGNLLDIAPHLAGPLPIMLPLYKWWQLPYYWAGIKVYDLLAGRKCLKSSYAISKGKALELFPMLKRDRLVGAIVYYDGQHNDSRMVLSIALTATRLGSTVANYVNVENLLKTVDSEGQEKIIGAKCRDVITGKEITVRAKTVVNATGPYSDGIRLMANEKEKKLVAPSLGVHIVLPDYYSPEQMGLLDPDTSDGRLIFFLPWEGHTIAGTTDTACDISTDPSPSEHDIQFILHEVRGYLSPDLDVRRGDVQSAWAGIRPLVYDPKKKDTQSFARNHIIVISKEGLITVAGGKWTTYRLMASEAIDAAVSAGALEPKLKESQTHGLFLEGAHTWTPTMYIRLVQDFGLESDVGKHLCHTYGDRAYDVAKLAKFTGQRWPIVGKRLHSEFPYIDAEVRYACKEYALTAVDVIARRLRLAFLNSTAAEEALDDIIEIMGEELSWNAVEKQKQRSKAISFLRTEMGQEVSRAARENLPVTLSSKEVSNYTQRFNYIDKENKGFITLNDLRASLESRGEKIALATLSDIIRELDINRNGVIELEEYLLVISAIKSGSLSHSRFAQLAEMAEDFERQKISVARSGGGL